MMIVAYIALGIIAFDVILVAALWLAVVLCDRQKKRAETCAPARVTLPVSTQATVIPFPANKAASRARRVTSPESSRPFCVIHLPN